MNRGMTEEQGEGRDRKGREKGEVIVRPEMRGRGERQG